MTLARRGSIAPATASAQVAATVQSPEQVLATHARTSFHFAARFLPRAKRRAATDLYAFFRTLDDLVDESTPADATSIRWELDAWRMWLDRSCSGRGPREPLASDLARVIDDTGVPLSLFQHLLDGLESDLGPREVNDEGELHTYCYQVASTVGCAMAHVLGATTPQALAAAERLGHAMQLTNILRDIGEDLDAGRVYLPRQTLAEYDLCRADLQQMRHDRHGPDGRFHAIMHDQVNRARALYAQAIPGIWLLPADSRLPILIASRLYRRLLDVIEQRQYDTLRRRASTSRMQKVQEAAISTVIVRLWCVGEGVPHQDTTMPLQPGPTIVELRDA